MGGNEEKSPCVEKRERVIQEPSLGGRRRSESRGALLLGVPFGLVALVLLLSTGVRVVVRLQVRRTGSVNFCLGRMGRTPDKSAEAGPRGTGNKTRATEGKKKEPRPGGGGTVLTLRSSSLRAFHACASSEDCLVTSVSPCRTLELGPSARISLQNLCEEMDVEMFSTRDPLSVVDPQTFVARFSRLNAPLNAPEERRDGLFRFAIDPERAFTTQPGLPPVRADRVLAADHVGRERLLPLLEDGWVRVPRGLVPLLEGVARFVVEGAVLRRGFLGEDGHGREFLARRERALLLLHGIGGGSRDSISPLTAPRRWKEEQRDVRR